MAPIHLGLLIPLVTVIAVLGAVADHITGLGRLPLPLACTVAGLGLLGLSAGIVYQAYTYLALEGQGSPNPSFAETQHLVTSGPYARVRHPTVTGKIVGIVGAGLIARSPTFLLLVVPALTIAALVSNRTTQEIPLERRMGDLYRDYRARVPMVFPRPGELLRLLRARWRVLLSFALLLGTVAWVGAPPTWPATALQSSLAALAAVPLFLLAGLVGASRGGFQPASALRRRGIALAGTLLDLDQGERDALEQQALGAAGSDGEAGSTVALVTRRGLQLVLLAAAYLVIAGATDPALLTGPALLAAPAALALALLPGTYDRLGPQDLGLVVLLPWLGVAAPSALALSLALHAARIGAQLLTSLGFLGQLAKEDRPTPAAG